MYCTERTEPRSMACSLRTRELEQPNAIRHATLAGMISKPHSLLRGLLQVMAGADAVQCS